MGQVLRLTNRNFDEEVLASELPVLVDFWASWCPPCKMMDPALDELADALGNRLKIAKVNVDQNRPLADRYDVLGLPTFILFQGGQVIEQRVGAMSQEQLQQMFDRAVA